MVNDEIDIDLSGVRDLFDNSIANKISSAIVVFFVVFMWFNSANLFANNDAIRSVIDGDTDWEVSFNESIITKTDSVIVADGDSEIILFDIPLLN